jgi:exodeoxyribonuclease V beta subunit
MEFHFKSADAEPERLFRIIRKQSGNEPGSVRASGFMTGFIDLIIRQNGRYYILDYKSNYLGDDLAIYDVSHLQQEILTNGYDLQYHLYTLALVQYLQKRIPDFHYETHFGGAAYLFVRGMRAGSPNGVWFHKPDQSVISQLGKELGIKI